jgi:hypothetical protein
MPLLSAQGQRNLLLEVVCKRLVVAAVLLLLLLTLLFLVVAVAVRIMVLQSRHVLELLAVLVAAVVGLPMLAAQVHQVKVMPVARLQIHLPLVGISLLAVAGLVVLVILILALLVVTEGLGLYLLLTELRTIGVVAVVVGGKVLL